MKKTAIFAILAIFTLITLGYVMTISSNQQFFYDGELGLVKLTSGGTVEQAYFKKTNALVGDRVTICEGMPVTSSNYIWSKIEVKPSLNGNTFSTIDFTRYAKANAGKVYCLSFRPTKTGTYTLNSYFKYCYAYTTGECNTIKNIGSNKLTVKEEERCDKSSYKDPWKTKTNIANGKVLYQTVYRVVSNCRYDTYDNIMTQCNDGYVIKGTTQSMTDNDGFECVAKEIPEEIPEDVDPECNADLMIECEDGSSIVLKQCVDDILVDSGLECQVIEDPATDDPAIDDPDTDDPAIDDPDTDDPAIDERTFIQKNGLLVVLGSILVIIVGLAIIYLKQGKKKK